MGRIVRHYIRGYNITAVNALKAGANFVTNAVVAAAAGKKIVYGDSAITGTGTITVAGLTTIEEAFVCVKNSATTIPTNIATVSGIAGNVISVVVVALAAAANSISGVAATVAYVAIGT